MMCTLSSSSISFDDWSSFFPFFQLFGLSFSFLSFFSSSTYHFQSSWRIEVFYWLEELNLKWLKNVQVSLNDFQKFQDGIFHSRRRNKHQCIDWKQSGSWNHSNSKFGPCSSKNLCLFLKYHASFIHDFIIHKRFMSNSFAGEKKESKIKARNWNQAIAKISLTKTLFETKRLFLRNQWELNESLSFIFDFIMSLKTRHWSITREENGGKNSKTDWDTSRKQKNPEIRATSKLGFAMVPLKVVKKFEKLHW